MTLLNGELNVLRIKILPPDDDHVLESSGDIAFSIFDKAEVARAQERPFSSIRQPRMKGLLCLEWAIPVTFSDGSSRRPDFADGVKVDIQPDAQDRR